MTTHRLQPRGLIAFVALSLAILSFATPGRSEAAVDVRIVDPQLASLPFGKDFDAIAVWLGKRIDKAWAPRIAKATELIEKTRLKAARDRELDLVRNNERIFDGRHTGLEVSIIAGEFGVNTGESLFSYKEGEETHYFFMHEGRLWKYLRVLAPAPSFAARMAQFQRGLGEPVAMADESDGEGGRRLVSTAWRKGELDLRLVNRRTVYGADVFIMEQRAVAETLGEARKVKGQATSKTYDSIEIFFLDDPHTYGAPDTNP